MADRGPRALVVFGVAVLALVAGYILGRDSRVETDPASGARGVVASSSDTARAERPPVRAPARPRRRADSVSEGEVREASAADGPSAAPSKEPVTKLRLRIRNRDGSPVAGARIRVKHHYSANDWLPLRDLRASESDGSLAVDLPQWFLDDTRRLHIQVEGAGFVARDVLLSRDTAMRHAIDVELDRAATVRGRCVDRGGQAVTAVGVAGPRDATRTATDRDGRFEIAGLPETGGYLRFFPNPRPFAAARVDLPPARDGVVDLGDVILEPGDTLRGRFLDAGGNPIAGAKATLVSRELEGVPVDTWVKTDAEGRFAFERVGRGTFDLGLVRPGLRLDGGDLTDIVYGVSAGQEVIVRATRDHYVGVQFVDEDWTPVTFGGGRILWYALDDTSDRLDWWGIGGGWDHFHIAARPGATYEIRVELDGYEPAVLRATARETLDTHVDAVLRQKMR